MSWVNGRQMASASDGTNTYSYIYDAAGSRIMKNVGTVNHLYFYVNGMLLMEYRFNAMGDTTDVLQYFYDANGKPHAMAYNGTVYLYVTNLQGDIVALLGLDGTVSGYEYDPYGNVIASYGDIAAINPLRYRGYYYDNETGLYYLQSRYYDPVVGRFINADSYASTGQGIIGCNMFAYCCNNTITMADFSGNVGTVAIICAVSATISGVSNAVATAFSGGSFQDCLVAGLVGAIGGGLGGYIGAVAPLPALNAGLLGRGVATILTDLGTSLALNGQITSEDLVWTAIDTTMDMTLSPTTYYYNTIVDITEQTAVNAFLDGATDVAQTLLFTNNSDIVQNNIRTPRDYARAKVGRILGIT